VKKAADFLKKPTRVWVNELTREYLFEERHIRVLNLAAGAWDRLDDIREILGREGYQVTDRFGIAKPHPLLAEERAQKRTFAALLRELGLDLEKAGEPPRLPPRR